MHAVETPEDAFSLDVTVIEGMESESTLMACTTNNGCPPSCASSCTSAA
jgi:FxLD family lantipeptide